MLNVKESLEGIDLDKCIFCQKLKKKEAAYDGDKGREQLLEAIKVIPDDERSKRINKVKRCKFKYHSKSCYSTFIKSSKRKNGQSSSNLPPPPPDPDPVISPESTRTKRQKVDTKKVCVICGDDRVWDKATKTSVRKLFRLCEPLPAQKLLNAAELNQDTVYTRIVFCYEGGAEDIYARDVHYHNNCLRKYFNEYDRKIESIMVNLNKEDNASNKENLSKVFEEVMSSFDMDKNAYTVSFLRDEMNKKLGDATVRNRTVKNMLLKNYENLCFTYPRSKRDSQMFFSCRLTAEEMLESMRCKYVSDIDELTTKLRQMFLEYDFKLRKSYCDSNDVKIASEIFKDNRPKLWMNFIEGLFPGIRNISEDEKAVSMTRFDALFQVLFFMIHKDAEPTPLHVNLAQTVHNLTRSKELITILNKMGFCFSYKKMKDIDFCITKQIISLLKDNDRVPLAPVFIPGQPISGAMDNFDHIERNLSGKGSSHDTVLVLFQNVPKNNQFPDDLNKISIRSKLTDVKIKELLPCQQLLRMGDYRRGKIPEDFVVSKGKFGIGCSYVKRIEQDYFLWILCRNLENGFVPSFTAIRSKFHSSNFHPTITSFVPILPYKATERDSVYTTMINFQDVLRQHDQQYGSLWCDEGVYCIAKEIQFLKPEMFNNLFLGLGGFHFEKIVYGCVGSYLKPSGIFSVLVNTECFGPEVIKTVMGGTDYVRSKEGISRIHEAVYDLMLDQYLNNGAADIDINQLNDLVDNDFISWDLSIEQFATSWMSNFKTYIEQRCKESQNFLYWYVFVFSIYPIVRDLTQSLRVANWDGYLSSVRRSLPLFFAFGRTNYARYAPIFFEDCMDLERKFPAIYDHFLNGGFVVNRQRQGSGTPMDQALEQVYNKPAKGAGGVIGITRRKEAVAMWNILKHEKEGYTSNLRPESLENVLNGENSLHHEFNRTNALSGLKDVRLIVDYIKRVCNPISNELNGERVRNIATGEENVEEFEFSMRSLDQGWEMYNEYVDTRLITKTVGMLETISRNKLHISGKDLMKPIDVNKEVNRAMKYIEYAKFRGYELSYLLKFEISSYPLYLIDPKNGSLKDSVKSNLSKELLSLIPSIVKTPSADCIFFDFMAHARKVQVSKINENGGSLYNFGDLFMHLYRSLVTLQDRLSTIHIIFDLYIPYSIKDSTRRKRSKEGFIDIAISSYQQKLPVEWNKYWNSRENKKRFQQAFITWVTENHKGDQKIILGGGSKDDSNKCIQVSNEEVSEMFSLRSTLEEADDRIMKHIEYEVMNGAKSITVVSSDTDILVCLLYHFVRWKKLGLIEIWSLKGSSKDKTFYPLHDLCSIIGENVALQLPAAHSLTGCDTTSKIGTKHAALKSLPSDDLIDFGEIDLTDRLINQAERFLVDIIKPAQSEVKTFNELRELKYYNYKSELELTKLPCTSKTIHLHIIRAFYQCYRWVMAPNRDIAITHSPEDYAYQISGEYLEPLLIDGPYKPDDLPEPCTCGKCARKNVCSCRIAEIPCCRYCKCKSGKAVCKNPNNPDKTDR